MRHPLTELAWAAGFFDGEGSVGAYRSGGTASTRPRPMVQIAQTDPGVLQRFAAAVGVGRVTGPYDPKAKASHPYWCFRIEGIEGVRHVAVALAPFLSDIKRKAFEDAIVAYLSWWNNPRCKRGHTMSRGKNGHPYCRPCRSATAHRRWGTTPKVAA